MLADRPVSPLEIQVPGRGPGWIIDGMPGLHTFALFSMTAVLFALFPGPAVLYIVTRSVTQGRAAGLVSASAVAVGNTVHVVAAVLGLSAVLASSAAAFTVVKYLGAAYLIYLGIRALRSGRAEHRDGGLGAEPLRRVFRQGVVVAVLNPKTALFFLAFLPQFLDRDHPAAPQVAVLGLLLVAITWVSDCTYAAVSGAAGGWLRGSARMRRRQRVASGGAYIALGVVAAVAEPSR